MPVRMWLECLAQDVRHALYLMRRSPGFAATTIALFAIGIGGNTAIFTFVSGVILRPLGYRNPDQLMYLATEFPALRFAKYGLSPPEYVEFRQSTTSFADVGAFTLDEMNLTAADRPLRVRSASVDERLLRTLGVQAGQGRLFARGETEAAGSEPPRLAVLSDELWRTAFGGQPLIGRTVDIDGRPHEVIGVMTPGVDVMDNRVEIWLPLGLGPADLQGRANHYLNVIGRLKDGVTPRAAQTELGGMLANWADRFGVTGAGLAGHVPTNRPTVAVDHIITMERVHDAILGDASRSIWGLQAGVGLVLLIVCANIASLFLARGETRRREYAVRAALGASRSRLLRQAMTEGALLAVVGGVLGVWLAHVGVRALIRAYPTSLPRTSEVALDVPVLLFALAVSTATGLLVGLVPLPHKRITGMMASLKEGGDRAGEAASRHHVRRALVAAEVAMAVIVVMGAGLLVRTVYNLMTVDAGFDRSRLVTFSMTLPLTTPGAARGELYQRLLATLRAAPGVQAATAMSGLPPNRSPNGTGTAIENHTAATGEPFEIVDYYQFVAAGYFQTMGIPIVAGRGFEHTDAASAGRVAVINETFANMVWKGRNPIGHRLRPYAAARRTVPWYTVVGVAKDVKQGGVDQKTGAELYMLVEQHANSTPQTMNIVLRTTLPPAALSNAVERLVHDVAPTVPVVRFQDMDSVFAESIRRPRLLAQLLAGFAGLALLLAAVGTYGVLAYVVAERRRDIGIRMALGAARSRVLAEVMREGLLVTTVGVLIGLPAALLLNRLLGSLLFGVEPTDPVTLAAVVSAIALVATLASWLPAWRASRVDPSMVLRDG